MTVKTNKQELIMLYFTFHESLNPVYGAIDGPLFYCMTSFFNASVFND